MPNPMTDIKLAIYGHPVKLNNILKLCHIAAAISLSVPCQRVVAYSQQDLADALRRASEAAVANPSDPLARNRVLEGELQKFNLPSKKAASYVFFAFYRKNMIGVPAVCAEYGIDVKEYVSSFARIHEPLLKVAETNIDLEKAKSYTDPVESARAELERIVTTRHTYMKGLCSVIATNGASIAERGQFAVVLPNAYAALTSP
ncbi:hypothetical protein GCT19_36225 [Paraburkholderia sp. CNPSo 3155]|uniref:hypothetical protein n=1 Tax=Paraburkholderia atlantica TaxID=2654982 RepID=UPI00128D78AC|nr:hypothetical protein [Paraburkholderia atlantica]MPW10970.1 hypothetical protein [Paraburkholderia atlantica]